MSYAQTLSERIEHINERLEEIEKQREAINSDPGIHLNDRLIEEEHQLQTLLQQLTDQLIQEDEGLAEQMVKAEAATADEIPDLPPDGDNAEFEEERSDQERLD